VGTGSRFVYKEKEEEREVKRLPHWFFYRQRWLGFSLKERNSEEKENFNTPYPTFLISLMKNQTVKKTD